MKRLAVVRRAAVGLALVSLLSACPITKPPKDVRSVTIEQGNLVLALWESVELTAVVEAEVGATEAGWYVDAEDVVYLQHVDDNRALVTAVGPGVAHVMAHSRWDGDVNDEIVVTVEDPLAERWSARFGTTEDDRAAGVAVSGEGDVYVAGSTRGELGAVSLGGSDVFLRKYAADGAHLWTRQFGTTADDVAASVAVDADGNVVIAGHTYGALTSNPNAGDADVFVTRFGPDGTRLWTEQLGTPEPDSGSGVAVDADGNVYVTGTTAGALGSPSSGGTDFFVGKLGSDGGLAWLVQLGSSEDDEGTDVATDGLGNAYVVGSTAGTLSVGQGRAQDAFVAKLDASGSLTWLRQFGGEGDDAATAASPDGSGGVVVVGSTDDLFDVPGSYEASVFVRGYDDSGTDLGSRQYGGRQHHGFHDVVALSSGGMAVVGWISDSPPEEAGPEGLDGSVMLIAPFPLLEDTRKRFEGEDEDAVVGIAVGPDGEVVIVGEDADHQGVADLVVRVLGP